MHGNRNEFHSRVHSNFDETIITKYTVGTSDTMAMVTKWLHL